MSRNRNILCFLQCKMNLPSKCQQKKQKAQRFSVWHWNASSVMSSPSVLLFAFTIGSFVKKKKVRSNNKQQGSKNTSLCRETLSPEVDYSVSLTACESSVWWKRHTASQMCFLLTWRISFKMSVKCSRVLCTSHFRISSSHQQLATKCIL